VDDAAMTVTDVEAMHTAGHNHISNIKIYNFNERENYHILAREYISSGGHSLAICLSGYDIRHKQGSITNKKCIPRVAVYKCRIVSECKYDKWHRW